MSADQDPLWKRIWKTEGIRWLGHRGDGSIDAMERFQHGFELATMYAAELKKDQFRHGYELGYAAAEGSSDSYDQSLQEAEEAEKSQLKWQQVAKDLAEAGTAVWGFCRRGEKPPQMVVGLFLEAARAYDRLLELQHEEGR